MLYTLGDTVGADDFATNIECKEFVGTYPVELHCDEDGNVVYVASDKPTGRLLVYKDWDGESHSIYVRNDVETSCLLDLF